MCKIYNLVFIRLYKVKKTTKQTKVIFDFIFSKIIRVKPFFFFKVFIEFVTTLFCFMFCFFFFFFGYKAYRILAL